MNLIRSVFENSYGLTDLEIGIVVAFLLMTVIVAAILFVDMVRWIQFHRELKSQLAELQAERD